MKAWGKKNPEIQKMFGVPLSIHFCKKLNLSFKSWTQEPNGFIDRNPTLAQIAGTCWSNSELHIFYSSSLITIKPLRAFLAFLSV